MEKVGRVHKDWQALREARWVHTVVLSLRVGEWYAIRPALNSAPNFHWFGYIHGLNRKLAIFLYEKRDLYTGLRIRDWVRIRDCQNFSQVTFPGSLLFILVLGWEGSSRDEMVCSMWLDNVSYWYQISCFYSNLESPNISGAWRNASCLMHLQACTAGLDDDGTMLRLKDASSVLIIMWILPVFRACWEKLVSQATREKRWLLFHSVTQISCKSYLCWSLKNLPNNFRDLFCKRLPLYT